MSQWKETESNKPTGFLDKNGVEIRLGDRVVFRRKVRAVRRWDRYNVRVIRIPGHYENVSAEVVGFGRVVNKHYYDNTCIQIEYVYLQERSDCNRFRVYRADNLTVINAK